MTAYELDPKTIPGAFRVTTAQGDIFDVTILSVEAKGLTLRYKLLQKEKGNSTVDLSTPEATIKSLVQAVYDGSLEAAKACVSKDGADYDELIEILASESNHPLQAMIKAMDVSVPIKFTSKEVTEDRCKLEWGFTLGRVFYYNGDAKMKKGAQQRFGSYLESVGDKWLIRDI
jgi:hypothetical protein